MISINEPDAPNDYQSIRVLKNSLLNSFSAAEEKEIVKAVTLANCLFTLGNTDEALTLLESFVYFSPGEQARQLWTANGQGIVLLSAIYRIINERAREHELIQLLQEDDIVDTANCSRYELFLVHLANHDKNMRYAVSETQQYKCSLMSQEVLKFLYFSQMLPFYVEETPARFDMKLKRLLSESHRALKIALQ